MIIFLPNCSASINFRRFIFKSFERHVCSAHFSKAGMRLGPQALWPGGCFSRWFSAGVALRICLERPRGGRREGGNPYWGLPHAGGT